MLYSCVLALAFASYTPPDTNIIVKKDDYAKYDNCDDPGNCAAPCASPQIFHARMCDSWMCTMCPSDYCKETCKKLQEEYPTCRCGDWPEHKKGYSTSDIPDVVLPTCKDGELVGCHTFGGEYYYYTLTACPEKLSFQSGDLYYYYDVTYTYYRTTYYGPDDFARQYYDREYYGHSEWRDQYYAVVYGEGQSHDGMLTYSGRSSRAGPQSAGKESIHMKFTCDENPEEKRWTGGAYENHGAEGWLDGSYYSEDGSLVYNVASKCAC
jgi:hypothetical protein